MWPFLCGGVMSRVNVEKLNRPYSNAKAVKCKIRGRTKRYLSYVRAQRLQDVIINQIEKRRRHA